MTEHTKHYYMPNEFTCKEQEIIDILVSVLNGQGIPPEYYSLNGYKEESVCLSKHGFTWEVYIAERGLQSNKKVHTKLEDAVNDMIRILAESKTDCDEMIKKMESRKSEITFKPTDNRSLNLNGIVIHRDHINVRDFISGIINLMKDDSKRIDKK